MHYDCTLKKVEVEESRKMSPNMEDKIDESVQYFQIMLVWHTVSNGFFLNDKGDLLRQDFEEFLDKYYPDE